MINGSVVGGAYILLLYLISSITSGNFGINFNSILMIAASVIFGGIGGIIGVNAKK
jgi:putative membrane protein (TIGR04086 family)